MATVFIEPGGDANFSLGFWKVGQGTPSVVSDFVHGGHQRSIKYRPGFLDYLLKSNIMVQAGGRISIYIYLNAYPSTNRPLFGFETASDTNGVARIGITSAGVLRVVQGNSESQIGTNGSTLSLGTWYRLSFCYTITSTTINEFRVYKDGILDISVSNATLSFTAAADLQIGNSDNDTTLDFRSSDHYVDNITDLTDPGNIWVTAKRPFANGTTNNFTTQIGSGGSGYGSGHAPQVNERPNSDANGWSIAASGSAITEEYTIESQAGGDISLTGATIVDYAGWVRANTGTNETANIIVNNATSNISLITTISYFTAIAGSTTYPIGGTDIGLITATTTTTVSLYECGILVAAIPSTTSATNVNDLLMMFR